jgi:prepilin-type N-terminal cleavage/methylation domain-containing protein
MAGRVFPPGMRRGDERGFGLVELLVSIVLLGIIGTIVSGLFISTQRTISQGQSLTGNTRQAANGMNEVARVIRAATANPVQGQSLSDPALVAATNESVTLYAYVNLASSAQLPVKIQLALDSNRRLVETQWASYVISSGYFGFNSTPVSTRIMAGTVATPPSGQPSLFTYVLPNGTVLPVPITGVLTTAQLRSIAAVQVTMTLQSSLTNRQSAVTLQNTVGMPNLGLSRTGWQ